jgi:hypothetical protein
MDIQPEVTPALVDRAVEHLVWLQEPEGCWNGEVVWNTTLLSQYVLTSKVAGRWPLPDGDRDGILRHRRPGGPLNQHQADLRRHRQGVLRCPWRLPGG